MKVFRKTEAKYFAKPNRHITVSGKIKINVERICHCIKPEEKHRFVVIIEKEVFEKFKNIAQQEQRSASNLASKLITDYVNDYETTSTRTN